MLCPPPDAAHAQPLCDQPSCEAFQEQQYTHFNHVALGHRVDMSSRLPSYFGQTKSTITLLTRLRRRPWSPPILTSGRGVGFVRQLDRSLRLRFLAGIPLYAALACPGVDAPQCSRVVYAHTLPCASTPPALPCSLAPIRRLSMRVDGCRGLLWLLWGDDDEIQSHFFDELRAEISEKVD